MRVIWLWCTARFFSIMGFYAVYAPRRGSGKYWELTRTKRNIKNTLSNRNVGLYQMAYYCNNTAGARCLEWVERCDASERGCCSGMEIMGSFCRCWKWLYLYKLYIIFGAQILRQKSVWITLINILTNSDFQLEIVIFLINKI